MFTWFESVESIFCANTSCGLHDIQSVLRLPILSCIGSGGLDNDDAIQLLNTTYSCHVEICSFWSEIMKTIAIKMGYTELTIPKLLEKSMQAPWSISVLALAFSKFYDIYLKGCQTCVNPTNC